MGLLNGHSTLRIYLHVMGFCEDVTCRTGKECELYFHVLYECDAVAMLRYFRYFSLGLELDP